MNTIMTNRKTTEGEQIVNQLLTKNPGGCRQRGGDVKNKGERAYATKETWRYGKEYINGFFAFG